MILMKLRSASSWFRRWLGGKCMCLDSVTGKVQPDALIQSGWKVFAHGRPLLHFENFAYKGEKRVPLEEWIVAEEQKANSGATSYTTGFHVYTNEKQKESNWRRVYYRLAHTKGTQSGKECVVARELYVTAREDDWPPLGK